MSKRPTADAALVAAATAFEEQLAEYARLAELLLRTPLTSVKHLERANQVIEEIGATEERLGATGRGLAQAISDARDRQQALADQMVAHLAGALGAPLWVMLHRAADWRWFVDRDDSPWYPGARLFRQVKRGQWDDVVGRVALALAERGRAPASTQTPQVDARVALAPPAVTRPGEAPGYEAGRNAVAHARAGILEYVAGDGAAGDSVAWYGEWLQPQLDLLATLIRPSSVVMELSAGIGAHAIPLVAAAGVAGHVLAGEARPEQRAILRRNLAANCAVPVTVMRGMPGRPAG